MVQNLFIQQTKDVMNKGLEQPRQSIPAPIPSIADYLFLESLMKLQSILSMSAVFLGLVTIPAMAGEAYVTNSSSWQHTYGKGFSESTFKEVYNGSRFAAAAAIKLEKGYSFTGGYHPVSKGSDTKDFDKKDFETKGYDYLAASGSLNIEQGKFRAKTESYSYLDTKVYGGSSSHTVGSGFRY
jgi:hypothetical protein